MNLCFYERRQDLTCFAACESTRILNHIKAPYCYKMGHSYRNSSRENKAKQQKSLLREMAFWPSPGSRNQISRNCKIYQHFQCQFINLASFVVFIIAGDCSSCRPTYIRQQAKFVQPTRCYVSTFRDSKDQVSVKAKVSTEVNKW